MGRSDSNVEHEFPGWHIRVVYADKDGTPSMFCAAKTVDEALVRAFELRVKGFDVWQIERAIPGTRTIRAIKVF